MVSITSRTEHCSLKEVHAMLLSFESRLESLPSSVINTDGSIPIANIATQSQSFHQRRTNTTEYQTNRSRNQFSNQSYRGGRGRGNFRGRASRGGSRMFNNRPQCQLCYIFGHTAGRCYYRFDINYSGPPNFQANSNINHSTTSNQMSAMVLSLDTGSDSAWYADSGASNHVTNELANLNLASEFQGNSKLQVGNGIGLLISHFRNSRSLF